MANKLPNRIIEIQKLYERSADSLFNNNTNIPISKWKEADIKNWS